MLRVFESSFVCIRMFQFQTDKLNPCSVVVHIEYLDLVMVCLTAFSTLPMHIAYVPAVSPALSHGLSVLPLALLARLNSTIQV